MAGSDKNAIRGRRTSWGPLGPLDLDVDGAAVLIGQAVAAASMIQTQRILAWLGDNYTWLTLNRTFG